MVSSRLVAVAGGAAAAVTLALPILPAHATTPVTDLYVATGGDDSHDCLTIETACATVNAATVKADATGTTIHVGAGNFDGPVRPGAFNRSVTIVGDSTATTTLTASPTTLSYDGTVVELYGTTEDTLSDLTVSGGPAGGIAVIDPNVILHLDHVAATGGGCDLYATAGQVDATDSTFEENGFGSCGSSPAASADIYNAGGAVSLVRTQVVGAGDGDNAIEMFSGSFTADQSVFDDSAHGVPSNSSGIKASGGTVTVTRSTFHHWGYQGVRVAGGSALLSDDTFQDNLVGVNVDSGDATVVRSTFQHEYASLQGSVSVAGSVLGSVTASPAYGHQECNGTITDLGYNLSTDGTCGFSGTSKGSVTGLNLDTALSDRGGPTGLTTVAIFSPSAATDTIPVGATYGVGQTPLCPASGATDLRGVPRPAGSACDAGSYEMEGTVTTVTGPATAKPHADVTFDALVATPAMISGDEPPAGTVTFTSGGTVLCADVPFPPGPARHALCATTSFGAGSHAVTATFVPTPDASTLHGSVSAPRTIKVGTTPAFTSAGKTAFVVGRGTTFRVHASGSPVPRITQVKGKLPAGLTFRAGNGTATISGNAKASGIGTHRITLQAKNLMGSVKQVLRIVVKR